MVATKYVLLGVALVLVLSIVGCGGDSPDDAVETSVKIETSAVQPTGVEHLVDMGSTWFTPHMLTIHVGDSLVFTNVDATSHPLINEKLGINVAPLPFEGQHTLVFDKLGLYLIRNENEHVFISVDVQADE